MTHRRIRRLDLRAPEVIEEEQAARRAWTVFIVSRQMYAEVREYLDTHPFVKTTSVGPTMLTTHIYGRLHVGKTVSAYNWLCQDLSWWHRFLIRLGFQRRNRPVYFMDIEGPGLRSTFEMVD